MTGDEFTARYRLREQLGQGDVVSFRATDARGAAVFVHVLRGEEVEPFDGADLDDRGRAELREVLEVEGLPVVVTAPIEAFSTFDAWRDARRASGAEAPGAFTRIFRVVEEPESGLAPPETPATVERHTPPPPAAQDPPPPPAPPAPDRASEPPPGRERSEPGEFTRRFGALRGPDRPPSSPQRAPGSGRPTQEERGARAGGEPPTRPVQPPAPAPPTTPRPFEAIRAPEPPTAAEEEATGVFTRIMSARPVPPSSGAPSGGRGGRPSSTGRPPDAYRAGPPPPPPPTPDPPTSSPPRAPDAPERGDPHAAGPFTLAMKGYRQPADPPASLEPSDYQVSDDYLSRLRSGGVPQPGGADARWSCTACGRPQPEPAGDAGCRFCGGSLAERGARRGGEGPPPPSVAPPPVRPEMPSGPSEYTRVIRGGGFGGGRPPVDPLGARGAPPPAPAPPPPAAQTPRGGSKTGIVVALVLILAAIAAILIYFMLRAPSG